LVLAYVNAHAEATSFDRPLPLRIGLLGFPSLAPLFDEQEDDRE
jgi:hypothetical protein